MAIGSNITDRLLRSQRWAGPDQLIGGVLDIVAAAKIDAARRKARRQGAAMDEFVGPLTPDQERRRSILDEIAYPGRSIGPATEAYASMSGPLQAKLEAMRYKEREAAGEQEREFQQKRILQREAGESYAERLIAREREREAQKRQTESEKAKRLQDALRGAGVFEQEGQPPLLPGTPRGLPEAPSAGLSFAPSPAEAGPEPERSLASTTPISARPMIERLGKAGLAALFAGDSDSARDIFTMMQASSLAEQRAQPKTSPRLSEAVQKWSELREAGQSETAAWDAVVSEFSDIPPSDMARLKSAVRTGGVSEKSMTLGQAMRDAEDALPPLGQIEKSLMENEPGKAKLRERRAQQYDLAIEQAVRSRNPELELDLRRAKDREIQGPVSTGTNVIRYELDPKTKKLVPVAGSVSTPAAPAVEGRETPPPPPPLIPEKPTYRETYRAEEQAQKDITRTVEMIREGNYHKAYAELLKKHGEEKAEELFRRARAKAYSQ